MEWSRRWFSVTGRREITNPFPGVGGMSQYFCRGSAPIADLLLSLGVMLGVYTGGISGAHLNPAVTFANCVFRRFPWRKFPIYMLAQTLGAMCASGVVYANYKSAIDVYEGGAGLRTVPGYSTNVSPPCVEIMVLPLFYVRTVFLASIHLFNRNRILYRCVHCHWEGVLI